MSVAKIIELTSRSNSSFDDAIRQGIQKAGETITNVEGAWVKDQQVVIDGNDIVGYQVSLKITFIVE